MSEKKERIAFFDTKPYDRKWFDQLNQHYHIKYYEHKLTPDSISLAQGCRADALPWCVCRAIPRMPWRNSPWDCC